MNFLTFYPENIEKLQKVSYLGAFIHIAHIALLYFCPIYLKIIPLPLLYLFSQKTKYSSCFYLYKTALSAILIPGSSIPPMLLPKVMNAR